METLITILYYLYLALTAFLYYMIFVIILSWVPGIYEQNWYRILRRSIDWYMGRFRGLLVVGPVDFTPILGFVLYEAALQALRIIILRL